jgi:dTDP-4-dehydrorhamnose reductase
MKKVMVFGSCGMLGHKLVKTMQDVGKVSVIPVTTHAKSPCSPTPPEVTMCEITGTGVYRMRADKLLGTLKPDVVVNCIGITKSSPRMALLDTSNVVRVNSVWPHELAAMCTCIGARLIHISTDCVFSGKKGWRKETHTCTATDTYGRSKILGEVDYGGHLTLRTSFIGHEKGTQRGLLEWYLNTIEKRVQGWSKSIYNGLTTNVVAKFISDEILHDCILEGLYHLAGQPITKYELLNLVREVYGADRLPYVEKDSSRNEDRTLDAGKLAMHAGLIGVHCEEDWYGMVQGMYKDYMKGR